ncbi:FAD dependent oxidoreductase [Trematosphaeria pertusa]|uniref:FAD dependent oxidoreductase n=1 Tax=Trematosphaeria pertusa TaxID=390896 RepID=A0A6A6J0Y5_9PLEO|nr:FAD dependent oxidoreductase [Trematosphaeria pertusa]KAF2256188.1 FAD dependent oxidoreductase [Trematosphaeria pertusa]
MDGHANGTAAPHTSNYDVVIIGAGISGINVGYRMQTALPSSTYTILEGRAELGGTWSLFKYPGIRSDSDLHTFGFPFNPWTKPNPIATGASIIEYMQQTAEKFGIDRKIQYKHKVASADWSSDEQRWRLEVDNEGMRKVYYAKFVIMGTGYYNYEKPLQADIPGLEDFKGTRVHPQFWPQDLEYAGKRMIVIGSGATAITILPAVVDGGVGQVTMLQRSPSYVMNMPQPKPGELTWYERIFPHWVSLRLKRIQFIIIPYMLYLFCRKFPTAAANFLRKEAKSQLPKDFPMDPHFLPAYNPWDQRLCFCPNNDFFKCFESGKAQIVTAKIKRVVGDGIELESGEKLDADIIVTATGLNLQLCGGIPLSVDKKPVDFSSCYIWRASMLSGVPNLGLIIGYVNASWTLGADSASRLLTRLMKFMNDNKYTSATPSITEEEKKDPLPPLALNSTYIKKADGLMPHAGRTGPWQPRDNYFKDNWAANRADLRPGMEFKRVST